ncbi:SEL1-like repeat protein [Aeromonas veronii]
MDKSELPEDITALIKAAEGGDAVAQFELGQKYQEGGYVGKDINKAIEWYCKAAEQGHLKMPDKSWQSLQPRTGSKKRLQSSIFLDFQSCGTRLCRISI